MKIEVFADADSVAREAAAIIPAEARASVAAHGRFIVAFSGGHTPWLMLRALADQTVPWAGVHVAQVDERVAPAGDPDRNLTHLRECLLGHAPLRPEQIYSMPVESLDLEAAAKSYAAFSKARKQLETGGLAAVRKAGTQNAIALGRLGPLVLRKGPGGACIP
jgi:6-phosphogluconolactonase/glucosamine-6-phosphate isomerase/deaminase